MMATSDVAPAGSLPPFPEREVRPQAWKHWAVVAICLLLAAGSVYMITTGEETTTRVFGIGGVLLFGGGGLWYLYSQTQNSGMTPIHIRRAGLEVPLLKPTAPAVLIPWVDIERVTVIKAGGVDSVGILLRDHERLLSQIPADQATATLRVYGRLQKGAKVAQKPIEALALSELEDPTGVTEALGALEPAKDLGDLLSLTRRKFGADAILAWNQLDRSPKSFAAELEEARKLAMRHRGQTGSITATVRDAIEDGQQRTPSPHDTP